MPQPLRRKLVKHFDHPGHAHELTFSCYRRLPLLRTEGVGAGLSQSIDRAMAGQGFILLAFVYMPEHVHLLVVPARFDAAVSRLLAAIKRPLSVRVKRWMQQHDDPMLERLTIAERPGKTVFRFWQEGSGYDRNIMEPGTLRKAVDYIHANPVRRGLVAKPSDWPWSSWHHYHGGTEQRVVLPRVHDWPEGW